VKEVRTDRAPAPIGPYSQALLHEKSGFVFTAGQIALDAGSGTMVEGGVREQTVKVMENLRAVLEAAGTGMQDVVKTTIYLADMGDFPAVNEVYAENFTRPPYPARTTVEIASLPKGALVEIDAVAMLPG
jgi:2-iminobutanoate/2-iminopropanoate deaminase